MASKYLKIGSLIASKFPDGSDAISIGLGQKGSNALYNLSVEVIVRDHQGKVVAQQTDGFINLTDPRKEPTQLLKAGIITEEQAETMMQGVSRLSEKVKYTLKIPRKA